MLIHAKSLIQGIAQSSLGRGKYTFMYMTLYVVFAQTKYEVNIRMALYVVFIQIFV